MSATAAYHRLCLSSPSIPKMTCVHHHHHCPHPPKSSSSSSSSSSWETEALELQLLEEAPPFWRSEKRLSKQLSMCETSRNMAWERRRSQILRQDQERKDRVRVNNNIESTGDLTDEDLSELKGSIELGFGFSEENGQRLCNTLPALDLYFAVNRQFSTSPISSPNSTSGSSASSPSPSPDPPYPSLGVRSSSMDSPRCDFEAWKICNPGDSPQQVKTKLRHWAQVVACSVMQSH